MSKLSKSLLVAGLIASMAISPAWADRYGHHGGHHGGGRGAGGGDGWLPWGLGLLLGTAVLVAATSPRPVYYPPATPAPLYPAPVYAMPPAVAVQSAPPAPLVAEQSWWYYCAPAAAYYPYVRYCPSGWTRVAPTPEG